jgi:hypothetical protein
MLIDRQGGMASSGGYAPRTASERWRFVRIEYWVNNHRFRIGERRRLGVILMTAGGCPGGTAVGVVSDRPTGRLLDLVVAAAFGIEVGFGGCASALRRVVGDAVVDVAAMRRYPATGELAGLVSSDH